MQEVAEVAVPSEAHDLVPQCPADHGNLCQHANLRFGLALEPFAYI